MFVFGTENDPVAWEVADKLESRMRGVEFIKTSNPDNIIGIGAGEDLVIMDAVRGIKEPRFLSINDLKENTAMTTHDIDLGMTLLLLHKTGRINEARIIGIPLDAEVDDELLSSLKSMFGWML